MAKVLSIIFVFLLLSFYQTIVSADNTSPSAKITVDRVSNIIDRAKDKITLFLKFSAKDKISYQTDLLEKRLAEIQYVFNSRQGDLIEPVTTRYLAYLGRMKDLVLKNKQEVDISAMKANLENHYQVFRSLEGVYGLESPFWLLLQHDINVVQNFKDSL